MIKILTTIDRDPNEMFMLWMKYYLNFFRIEDFIIVYRGNNIESLLEFLFQFTKQISISNTYNPDTLSVVYKTCDRNITKELVSTWKLNNYIKNSIIREKGYVIGVDQDEFLYAENLLEYIENVKICAVSTSFDVIQIASDKPLDWNQPVLKQRSMWKYHPYNNKPCIIKGKVKDWISGRHNNTEYKNDINLICLHLVSVDYDFMYLNTKRTTLIYDDYISKHRPFLDGDESFKNWFTINNVKDISPISDEVMNNCILNKIFL